MKKVNFCIACVFLVCDDIIIKSDKTCAYFSFIALKLLSLHTNNE